MVLKVILSMTMSLEVSDKAREVGWQFGLAFWHVLDIFPFLG